MNKEVNSENLSTLEARIKRRIFLLKAIKESEDKEERIKMRFEYSFLKSMINQTKEKLP